MVENMRGAGRSFEEALLLYSTRKFAFSRGHQIMITTFMLSIVDWDVSDCVYFSQ